MTVHTGRAFVTDVVESARIKPEAVDGTTEVIAF